MKKFLSCIASAMCLLSFFSCSNDLTDSKNLLLLHSSDSNSGYGTIIVSDSDSRKIAVSDLTNLTATVSGYGMEDVTGTVLLESGKTAGNITVEKVPVGKNRVISIGSGKTVIRELISEVNSGSNSISCVTWDTTVLGSIYYYLIKAGVDVSGIDSSIFTSAIPTDVHACLVDAASIASDYQKGKLGAASSYKLSAGTVTATVYGYSGKTIQIADPSSSVQTAGVDGTTVTFTDVLPGKWNVYADGNKVKTITVVSGNNEVTIGSSISGRVIVFANDSEKKTFYIWKNGTETSYSAGWPGSAATSATDDMMNNPDGWYYVDITDKYDGGSINLILNNNGSNQTGDLKTGKTATFWYDAAGTCGTAGEIYDSDPTENQLSNNANLASISVNGTAVSGFASGTTSYTSSISAGTTSATVTAVAEDSAATVIVSPSGSASIASGESQVFTITVTAEDGSTKTYTVTVKRAAENDTTLASISVNGKSATISGTTASINITGSEDSLSITSIVATAADSNASVTYSATTGTIADGASKNFTITVKNGTKTAVYTLTVTYTKKTTPEYYWTNKNGAVGNNKTITGISSWSEEDKIIQGVACDTPRCWLGGHEYPDPDLYAMFAAWDDTNLYLLIEIPNVDDADAVDNDKCYAGSQFLPMGIVLNTGKRTAGNGLLDNGNSVWQGSKLYTWEEGVDTMLMFHPRLGIGEPSIFKTQSDGTFTYESSVTVAANKQYCIGFAAAGVEREIFFNKCVSSNMWAAVTDEEGNWGSKSTTDMDSYSYVDYMSSGYGKKMSSYQVTIPLSALDIDKNYIENTGISVGCFSTYGASTMDCLPWDSCMIDNAAESYSSDPSSSKEKEDADNITVSLARIGK